MKQRFWHSGTFALLAAMIGIGSAAAAPGDVYRVTADRVNLRAGPSDDATVRTTVKLGEHLIELERKGEWVGVRVGNTGEEGWIYEDLLKRIAQSRLGTAGTGGPFEEFSRTFNSLMTSAKDTVGYPLVAKVRRTDTNTLRVTPTKEWLLKGGSDSHVMGAIAFYEMWKSYEDGAPVTVVLVSEQNRPYVTVRDTDAGPELRVARLGERLTKP